MGNGINTKLLEYWDRIAKSPTRRILLCLFITAILVRGIFCIISPNPYQGLIKGEIISDAVEYDALARTLASGGGFGFYPGVPTAFRNPLVPFLAAGVYLVTGPYPIAAMILMIFLGSLIPPVLFALARQFVEPAPALLAALAAVFYPPLVTMSASLMTESLFTLLFVITLLFWIRFSFINRGGWNLMVWGGIIAGLALLTRSTLAPLLLLWIIYLLIDGGRDRWRHLLRYGVFFGVTLLTILPWSIRNYAVFGNWSWIATNGGYYIWQRHNLLPPDGTIDSRQDVQEELKRLYGICKARIENGDDPVDVFRPYMAQTVRGYLLRLGPKEYPYVHSFDGLNEAQVDRRLVRETFAAMVQFPVRTAIKIVKNTIKYWEPFHDPDVVHKYRRYNFAFGIMAPFMLFGIYYSIPQRRRFALLYVSIFSFWAITAIALHEIRYRLSIECIGLIFAAIALYTLFRRPGKPWMPWAVIGLVLLANLALATVGGPILFHFRELIHGIQ